MICLNNNKLIILIIISFTKKANEKITFYSNKQLNNKRYFNINIFKFISFQHYILPMLL